MINAVIADDHDIVRKGIRAILNAETDIKIVGEAKDGLETVSLVEKLKPDILVLDLMMSGINGLEVTRQLHKRSSRTGIIILSMHGNEAYVLDALRSGARAYILKENSVEELVHAIREVQTGHRYLSSSLSDKAIDVYTQKSDSRPEDPYDQLTTREREVLQMAAQGLSNTEIAERLFVSPRTIETHRANLMHKLDIHSHTELFRFAVSRGIITK